MKIEELQILINDIVKISDHRNYLENTETIVKAIFKYREHGGLGKPLDKLLLEMLPKYEGDETKEEILLEIGLRINLRCSPHLRIHFEDL